MKELLRRLRCLFNRSTFERELDEEMQHHLAMLADKGTPHQKFGNIALIKENSRGMWTFTFWEQLGQDIRYGIRAMAANKLFTGMAVLSLALGIGANTAIYSFMDAILMRTLPVPHPEELVILNWSARDRTPVTHSINGSMFRDDKRGRVSPNFPYPAYEALRDNHNLPATIFAYARAYELNLVVHGQAEVSKGMYVSGAYYQGLHVIPAAGRLIRDDDDRPRAPPVVVLSYAYWQSRFAARPEAIGSQIAINNVPFTVVGVSAPEFYGVNSGHEAPVSVPLSTMPLFAPKPETEARHRFLDKNFYWVEMMARLRPGANITQAEVAISTAFHQYVADSATNDKERTGPKPVLWLQDGALGLDSLRRKFSKPLFVLMTMVGLILAIACANIANLLLSRATARRREMAVRMSLGAGRWRVIRQLLTESVLLSSTGGVLGLLVAVWGIRSIVWLLSTPGDELSLHTGLNWPVLGFTLGLAVLTGIIFGLAPALQATGVDVTPALKESRSSAVTGKRRRFGVQFGLGQVLVVSQVAISLVLAVAAGLFVRTLSGLNKIELGFNRENILVFRVNAKQAGYKDAALAAFYQNLLERFGAIPGVKNAGLSDFALVSYHWNETNVIIPGAPPAAPDKRPSAALMNVDQSFLAVMQIPVLLGRGIEARDIRSPRVAVVTEAFGKKFFPGASPVGQRIGLDEKQPADIEIIGVAKTTKYNSLQEETPPVVYIPYTQDLPSLSRVMFELRTVGDPLALSKEVRRIVHDANASLPIADMDTQAAVIDHTISEQRTFANLCTGFAVLALVIACVGLYGTMAYGVARRTNEIGIRMALGAKRGGIVWMVLRQVAALAIAGLAIGLGIAWQTGHLVASFLYGVKPTDALVMAGSALVLALAAVLAGFAPAWRASRIDPMVALRHE